MTVLLIFLKIIAYILSVPVMGILTILLWIVIYSRLLMLKDKRTKANSLGYINGKLGVRLFDLFNYDKDKRKQYVDGYNEVKKGQTKFDGH